MANLRERFDHCRSAVVRGGVSDADAKGRDRFGQLRQHSLHQRGEDEGRCLFCKDVGACPSARDECRLPRNSKLDRIRLENCTK